MSIRTVSCCFGRCPSLVCCHVREPTRSRPPQRAVAASHPDASIALISELGYDNVSIEAIARRAGCGKQTIYRWWPSKGAVVLEAATRSLNPVVVFPDTGDIVADLRTQLLGILELVTTTGFGAAYRGVIAAANLTPTCWTPFTSR